MLHTLCYFLSFVQLFFRYCLYPSRIAEDIESSAQKTSSPKFFFKNLTWYRGGYKQLHSCVFTPALPISYPSSTLALPKVMSAF